MNAYIYFENYMSKLANVLNSLIKPIEMDKEFENLHKMCFVDFKDQ